MANYQQGFRWKLRVNNAVYSATYVTIDDTCGDLPTTNTEGKGNGAIGGEVPGFATRLPGILEMRASVRNASFDTTENPFLAPRIVGASNLIILQAYPAGLAGVSWFSASFLLLRVNQVMDVTGLQPVSFDGASNGFYSDPVN